MYLDTQSATVSFSPLSLDRIRNPKTRMLVRRSLSAMFTFPLFHALNASNYPVAPSTKLSTTQDTWISCTTFVILRWNLSDESTITRHRHRHMGQHSHHQHPLLQWASSQRKSLVVRAQGGQARTPASTFQTSSPKTHQPNRQLTPSHGITPTKPHTAEN